MENSKTTNNRNNRKSLIRHMSDLVSVLGCRSTSNVVDGGAGNRNKEYDVNFSNNTSKNLYKKHGMSTATVVSSASSATRENPPVSTFSVGASSVGSQQENRNENIPVDGERANPKEVWSSPRQTLEPSAPSTALLNADKDDHTNDEEEKQVASSSTQRLVLRSMPSKDVALSIYDDLDVDKNGWLSLDELGRLSKPIFSKLSHRPSIKKAYQVADKNSDGHLNRHEYEIFVRYIAFYNDAWDIFGNNGKHWDRLRKTNFVQKAKALGVTTNDPDKVFSLMNTNRNDHIEYEEYCSWMAKNTCSWKIGKKGKGNSNSNSSSSSRRSSARSTLSNDDGSSVASVENRTSRELDLADNNNTRAVVDPVTTVSPPAETPPVVVDIANDAKTISEAVVAAVARTKEMKAPPARLSSSGVSKAASHGKKVADAFSQGTREFTTARAPVSPTRSSREVIESKNKVGQPPPFKPPAFLLQNMPTPEETLRVFDELDDNDNQTLSFFQLGALLKRFLPSPAHKANVARAHNAADENSDGMLRRDELEAFMRYAVYFDNAWTAFTEDDAGNHVSKVDKSVFRSVIATRFGLQGNVDQNEMLFDEIDKNHSAFITYDEFCTWMARNSCIWHLGAGVPTEPIIEERLAPKTVEEPVTMPSFTPPPFLLVNMPTEAEALRVFDELDDNKNEILSFFGLGDALDRLLHMDTNRPVTRKAIVARAHHAADENADGMLRRCEFECFVRYAVYHNNAWDAFIDDESNGGHASKVDKLAFQRIVAPTFGLDEADYDRLFDEIDGNHSMLITYDEFCTWMARNSLMWKCTTTITGDNRKGR